jgi:hypothetical protein
MPPNTRTSVMLKNGKNATTSRTGTSSKPVMSAQIQSNHCG